MWSSFKNTSGMALLTVLVAMMIISLMLFEFQHNTMVERKLAYNDLNQTQAYYLAKSGINVGLLRLVIYGRLQNSPIVQNYKQYNLDKYLNMVWETPMPPFPPEAEDTENMLKKDQDAAEEASAQSRIETGQYSQTVTTESNKINLNFLIDDRTNKSNPVDFNNCGSLFCYTGALLVSLIEGFIEASDDPYEEFGNIRSEEIVYNIMDWVNPGNESYSGGDKDAHYISLDPPYRAKRNRFYTVDELRMIKDVNENLFRKLKPHVTVYSYDGKININTLSKELLKALDRDFTEYDLKRIMEFRDEQGGFPSASSFVDYVANTIGKSGFKQRFDPPDDFFTVGGEGFIVESLGIVKKSASQVQRSIRVAVALTTVSKGGQKVPGSPNEKTCRDNQSYIWNANTKQCLYRPTTKAECTKALGTWSQQNGAECCQIKTECHAKTGGSSTSGGKGPPNAAKILHWAES